MASGPPIVLTIATAPGSTAPRITSTAMVTLKPDVALTSAVPLELATNVTRGIKYATLI